MTPYPLPGQRGGGTRRATGLPYRDRRRLAYERPDGTPHTKPSHTRRVQKRRGAKLHRGDQAGRVQKRNRT